MADVTIPFEGKNKIRMPQVCIVCGDRPQGTRKVMFQSNFRQRGFLGTSEEYTRILHTQVPLCGEHWGYFHQWFWEYTLVLGFFVCIPLAIVSGAIFQLIPLVIVCVLGAIGCIVTFVVVNFIRQRGRVRATQITRTDMTLTNVSRKFANAVDDIQDNEDTGPWGKGKRKRRRGDDEEEGEDASTGAPWGIIAAVGGGIFALLFLICLGVIFLNVFANLPGGGGPPPNNPGPGQNNNAGGQPGQNPGQQPGQNPGGQPTPEQVLAQFPAEIRQAPNPPPVDPTWNEAAMQRQFLSDMPEYDTDVGWGRFGKNGMLGFPRWSPFPDSGNDPFTVGGSMYPKGISMHGKFPYSRVKYRLNRQWKLLRGAAAMADIAQESNRTEAEVPVVFTAFGDGRLLWRSKPIQKKGEWEDCRVPVTGVNELELRVYLARQGGYTWTVWLDPRVLK